MTDYFDGLKKDMGVNEEGSNEAGSDFYTIENGDNRIRVLSQFVAVKTVWEGNTPKGLLLANQTVSEGQTVQTKAWAWALIRATGEIKIVKLGKTIMSSIINLKDDEEFKFSAFPMPYDLSIQATGAGTKEVVYSVLPRLKSPELTEEQMAEYAKKTPIKNILARMEAKQTGKTAQKPEYPESMTPKF